MFASAKQSGQSTMKDDDCLFIKRNGYLEESYFSWSIIPLVGEDGSVVGLYNPCFEKTRRRIAERRMLTLREVGERTATARDIKGFWGQVIKGLEYNGKQYMATPISALTNTASRLRRAICLSIFCWRRCRQRSKLYALWLSCTGTTMHS